MYLPWTTTHPTLNVRTARPTPAASPPIFVQTPTDIMGIWDQKLSGRPDQAHHLYSGVLRTQVGAQMIGSDSLLVPGSICQDRELVEIRMYSSVRHQIRQQWLSREYATVRYNPSTCPTTERRHLAHGRAHSRGTAANTIVNDVIFFALRALLPLQGFPNIREAIWKDGGLSPVKSLGDWGRLRATPRLN